MSRIISIFCLKIWFLQLNVTKLSGGSCHELLFVSFRHRLARALTYVVICVHFSWFSRDVTEPTVGRELVGTLDGWTRLVREPRSYGHAVVMELVSPWLESGSSQLKLSLLERCTSLHVHIVALRCFLVSRFMLILLVLL